ncbi:lysophospholipid acyltransferase family protein [Terriglobus aquaticus]|uniref:1-acyl-sn-glycerol-3-phosphate acyltransferase n=1 Tax=Terriglobus aquaticus TaxID=940139 RepID=A0ABW9KHH8_9BACT|nr:lysophospholipid acyltransferase family protein [Terriglobus aquaticus]
MSLFSTAKAVTVFTALGVPAGLIGMPLTLATRDVGWMYRAGQRIAHLGLVAAGIRFDVRGRENIPTDRPCIFMANHVSNLDPPALVPMLPGTPSIMLKKSLMKIPVLGPAMKMGKFVPVERDGDRRSAVQAAKAAAEAIQSGLSLLVFIEGTRSRTGRLLPFKRGPFHLAQSTGAPIVPIALWGTEQMMQKGSAAITPGTAHIRFLPPVSPADHPDRNNLLRAVRESILSALPEHMHPLPAEAANATA